MAVIKPTFTLTANKSSASTNPGPLSVALALNASDLLTVDSVKSEIVTVGTSSALLIDGSIMSGTETTTEGAGGTFGGFVWMKNTTASGTNLIYIGVDHDGGSGELQADDQDDSFTGATRMFTLKRGEFAWFPFDYTMDIFVDANAAAQQLEYWVFDRG